MRELPSAAEMERYSAIEADLIRHKGDLQYSSRFNAHTLRQAFKDRFPERMVGDGSVDAFVHRFIDEHPSVLSLLSEHVLDQILTKWYRHNRAASVVQNQARAADTLRSEVLVDIARFQNEWRLNARHTVAHLPCHDEKQVAQGVFAALGKDTARRCLSDDMFRRLEALCAPDGTLRASEAPLPISPAQPEPVTTNTNTETIMSEISKAGADDSKGLLARAKTTAVTEAEQAVSLTVGKQVAKRLAIRALKIAARTRRIPKTSVGIASSLLETQFGLGVFAILLGVAAPFVPRLAATPSRAKLVSAMRVWGGHAVTDAIADEVLDELVGAFDEVEEEMAASEKGSAA